MNYVSPVLLAKARLAAKVANQKAGSIATQFASCVNAPIERIKEIPHTYVWEDDGGRLNDNIQIPRATRNTWPVSVVELSDSSNAETCVVERCTETSDAARGLVQSVALVVDNTQVPTLSGNVQEDCAGIQTDLRICGTERSNEESVVRQLDLPVHEATLSVAATRQSNTNEAQRIPTVEEVYAEMLDLRAQLFAKLRTSQRWKHPDEFIDEKQLMAAAITCRFLCHDREPSGALRHSVQCIAPTGAGKTVYYAMVVYYCRTKCPEHFPPGKYVIVCAPKAVIDSNQIGMEFAKFGDIMLNTFVTSLPSLRASLGEAFVEWKTVIVNEQPVVYPFWRPYMYPCLLLIDESQQLKNEESDQSKVIESASCAGIPVLVGSATPYSRIKQAKVIACALRPYVEFGGNKRCQLDVNIWPSWSKSIAHPKDPSEWSPSALRRLQAWLEPHTVRFTCTYPHKIIVKASLASFANSDEEDRYMATMAELDRIRAERGKNELTGFARELVAINKHCQTAEEIGAPHMVDAMLSLFSAREKARTKASFILGFSHRTALEIAAEYLRSRGVSDNEIARIHGGQPDRAKHVDRFKKDRAPFCLLTISAGGAGLDLGHNRFNRRQRMMIARACWNDIQFAQLAGRCHRRNSLSATYLYIVAFEGTEEMRRLNKLLRKTRSLREVITAVDNSSTEAKGAASFFEASDDLEVERQAAMMVTNGDEESEDAAAEALIGTPASLEYTTDEDE